jgi:hypothetical protein
VDAAAVCRAIRGSFPGRNNHHRNTGVGKGRPKGTTNGK